MSIFRIVSVVAAALAAGFSSVLAQSDAVPIADTGVGGLMGGVQNHRWLSPEQMGPLLGQRSEFVLIGPDGIEEGGVTWGVKEPPSQDICQDLVGVEFELESHEGVAVGTGAKWSLVPRPVRPVDVTSPVYKKVVADLLRTKGLPHALVKILRIYRVDLDGDGSEEVLIEATNFKNGLGPSAAAGDYSTLLMRKIVGRTVRTVEIDGEYIRKKIEFGAPSELKLAAIADLNGDGRMEIVTYSAYYEGNSSTTFELVGDDLREVKELSIGCGV
jgi:hypothetical protein